MSKPRQTILTLVGIVLGTAAFVAISGMMLGFQSFLVDQLVNNDSHIRITARDEPVAPAEIENSLLPRALVQWLQPPAGRRGELSISNVQGWMNRLSSDARVEAFAPQLIAKVMIRFGRSSVAGRLVGIDAEKQTKVSTLNEYVQSASSQSQSRVQLKDLGQSGNRVIVGKTLMENLGAQVGQTLLVSTGVGEPIPVQIIGTFLLGLKGVDDTTLYGALTDVQQINRTPGVISDLAIRLWDVTQARKVAEGWALLSRDRVQSWDQANENLISVFKTQDVVRISMTVSILVVAGFGIFNILTMTVNQKRKEIAILRSVGYEPKAIVQLFFNQGIVLGAIGGILGVILGYLACLYMSTLSVGSGKTLGTTGKMLVSFDSLIYVRALLLAFASCSVASILPARAAGKLHPMDIIRSE